MRRKWRPVVGYEGSYEVSDDGKVRRCKYELSFDEKERRPVGGRLVKDHPHQKGYRTLKLYKKDQPIVHYVHRLVLTAFRGPCPDGHTAGHVSGIRHDNTLQNLEWQTWKEQMDQRDADGMTMKGEQCGASKLTPAQVLEIRASKGQSHSALGKLYGVSASTIASIRYRETWAHLP